MRIRVHLITYISQFKVILPPISIFLENICFYEINFYGYFLFVSLSYFNFMFISGISGLFVAFYGFLSDLLNLCQTIAMLSIYKNPLIILTILIRALRLLHLLFKILRFLIYKILTHHLNLILFIYWFNYRIFITRFIIKFNPIYILAF